MIAFASPDEAYRIVTTPVATNEILLTVISNKSRFVSLVVNTPDGQTKTVYQGYITANVPLSVRYQS